MKNLVPSFIRILILLFIVTTVLFAYNRFSSSPKNNLPPQLELGLKKISSILDLNFDSKKIAAQAKEKLVDQQSIISDKEEISEEPQVLGNSTSISNQAKQVLDDTAQKISSELKNLPKKQAAEILRQTCDQMISELER